MLSLPSNLISLADEFYNLKKRYSRLYNTMSNFLIAFFVWLVTFAFLFMARPMTSANENISLIGKSV